MEKESKRASADLMGGKGRESKTGRQRTRGAYAGELRRAVGGDSFTLHAKQKTFRLAVVGDSFLGIFASLLLVMITACAPVHQVVKAKTVKSDAGERKFFYGVTYNHTLIPEYTKSAKGQYAESYDEAASLYYQRGAELDSWIGNKYRLTNSTWYRLTSPIPKAALIAVYPFVVPVEWLGERLFPDPSLGGRRTFRQITSDYFEPTFDMPALQIVSAPQSDSDD